MSKDKNYFLLFHSSTEKAISAFCALHLPSLDSKVSHIHTHVPNLRLTYTSSSGNLLSNNKDIGIFLYCFSLWPDDDFWSCCTEETTLLDTMDFPQKTDRYLRILLQCLSAFPIQFRASPPHTSIDWKVPATRGLNKMLSLTCIHNNVSAQVL